MNGGSARGCSKGFAVGKDQANALTSMRNTDANIVCISVVD
jgi:hypothetical protein